MRVWHSTGAVTAIGPKHGIYFVEEASG